MKEIQTLLQTVEKFYAKNRRDFPWRKTRDPYKILVSEVMLQQTQATRVVGYYERWIKKFLTAKVLAKTPLSKVLKEWQGLGYNRRAKFLHEAAKTVAISGFPKTAGEIEKLPGVGPYTARAVAAFAFNKPEVFIETNIRTVFIRHCYSSILQKTAIRKVSDAELLPKIEEALKQSKMQPRDFYAALMDYGAFLKASGVKLNSRSKHYVKQSKFEGSARQLRGALLRELLKKPQTISQLTKHLFPRTREEVLRELTRLEKERLVERRALRYRVA